MRIDRTTFKWWLIYGPPRTGTSYLSRMIGKRARYLVSDWGIGHLVNGLDRVRELDKDRYLSELAVTILDGARRGGGARLDLCYKQALLLPEELKQVTKMYGAPERRIFCIREPASFMASASKKFPNFSSKDLEKRYVMAFSTYDEVGGDIVEYGPRLTQDTLGDFIAPLTIPQGTEKFEYRGSERPDLVTPLMQQTYEDFRRAHFDGPDKAFVLKS